MIQLCRALPGFVLLVRKYFDKGVSRTCSGLVSQQTKWCFFVIILLACSPEALSATPYRDDMILTAGDTAQISSPFGLHGIFEAPQPTCEEVRRLGARSTWWQVPWAEVEPQQDYWDWTKSELIVRSVEACGGEVFPKLFSRSPWATVDYQGPGGPSFPPKSLADYYDFVHSFATHFKGRIKAYAIENEINSPGFWRGSLEQYQELLTTAYRAIKDADPTASVVSNGVSSRSYGTTIARELYESGKVQEAIAFYNRYYAHRRVGNFYRLISTEAELRSEIYSNAARRNYDFVKGHFHDGSIFDVYQLHFYEEWDLLPELIAWVKDQMRANGYEKPIEAWEIGYAWWDEATYDTTDHANDTVKVMVTALGEGARRVIYLSYRGQIKTEQGISVESARGLLDPQGNPRPVKAAYATTTRKLTGFTTVERLDLGQGVWAYKFTKPAGSVYVLWSEVGATVALPVQASSAIITDIFGQERTADPRQLLLTASPIFVEVSP